MALGCIGQRASLPEAGLSSKNHSYHPAYSPVRETRKAGKGREREREREREGERERGEGREREERERKGERERER